MPTKNQSIYVVKDGFVGDYGKGSQPFPAGERFTADHPAVKKWPQLFRAEISNGQAEQASEHVEQATAAPGEKRG